MENPKRKLFETIFDNEVKALFPSQKRLVELLCEASSRDESEVSDDKRKSRMQIFLSNCITGKRRLSRDLKSMLSTVLDVRLANNHSISEIKEDIFRSFDFHYKSEAINKTAKQGTYSKLKKKSTIHQIIFQGFMSRGEEAESILKVTSVPAENSQTKTGNKVIEFVSESIGLYGTKKNKKKYTYFFPDTNNDEVAIKFWKTFYDHNKRLGIENIEEKINEANINKSISVYSSNSDIINFPVTCFNYNDYYREFAYSSNLIDDLLVVMPLNPKIFSWWKDNMEGVFSDGNKNEILFKNAHKAFKNKSPIFQDALLVT